MNKPPEMANLSPSWQIYFRVRSPEVHRHDAARPSRRVVPPPLSGSPGFIVLRDVAKSMMIRSAGMWGLLITAAFSVACEDRKSPWAPETPTRVARVELEGPVDVAPGQTASLRAMAVFQSGARLDVTDRALWTTSSATVLAVTAPGMVAGRERGEATITATYAEIRAVRPILVLEPGTYRIAGRVLWGTEPVLGARVVVSRGIGSGLATTSGNFGAFALYGVAGDIDLTISQDGYRELTRTLAVASNATADMSLEPSEPPFQMTGDWILTVQAASSCHDLPPEANTRTYRASVAQSEANIVIELRAERWIWQTDIVRLEGRVSSRNVAIEFPDDPLDGPWVQEQLPSGSVVGIAGRALGTRAGDEIAGQLSGEVTFYVLAPQYRWEGCASTDHTFRLSRP